jgi:hypothetical protein
MDESHFEEHQDNDGKGKGRAMEEKEALPDRVEQMGIDQWSDIVMNHVTETTPTESNAKKKEPNQPSLIHLPPDMKLNTIQPSTTVPNNETSEITDNHRMTIKGHDNGPLANDLTSKSVLMGKLCRRALALIKHKVSADGSVSDHMAQALATWLWQWGITIYTESEL